MAGVGYQCQDPVTGPAADRGGVWDPVDQAALGGGQRRVRVVLHFEKAEWAHVPGPLPELQPQPGPPRNLRWALDPPGKVRVGLEREGRFEVVDRDDAPGRPKLAGYGYLYTPGGDREVGVRNVVELTAAARKAEEQTAAARGPSPNAPPFVPCVGREDQAKTQAEGAGRAPPEEKTRFPKKSLEGGG